MPWVWQEDEEEVLEDYEDHWLARGARRLAGDDCVHNVFGSVLDRKAMVTTWCMVIVVGLTIGIEGITHWVETLFKDSPFMPLVHKLYKELMIMGIIAFSVFIGIQTSSIPENAILEFEFAHIVLFFFAIFLILQTACMGYLSKTTRLLYDRLHHFPIKGTYDAALDTTVDIPKTTFFKVPRQATGFWGREYDVRYLLEFKIISSFFIDEHKLPRTFDFAHYLAASLELHMIDIVEIDIVSWLVIIVLMLLNLPFRAILKQPDICDGGPVDDDG
eukprot:CAMPEP_0119526416 /NCGR_PEP_ID=MMETSP1344-20130328/41035_1 /TAXON_ID=236787 /ORGANISM="Florenciella parvula, Strain CCMP2471" /LENGTH=273 /DNA_ID=CAMNT_0007565395 /DNA_START=227 /DNA_END=1044 /DNA_ORIENTATION=+